MSDSTKEIVKPGAEAVAPSIHPDASPHIETTGDIEHLANIQAALSEHGVETTGELTQVLTEPQNLDSSQFETRSGATAGVSGAKRMGKFDDPSTWNSVFMKKQQERKLQHAA